MRNVRKSKTRRSVGLRLFPSLEVLESRESPTNLLGTTPLGQSALGIGSAQGLSAVSEDLTSRSLWNILETDWLSPKRTAGLSRVAPESSGSHANYGHTAPPYSGNPQVSQTSEDPQRINTDFITLQFPDFFADPLGKPKATASVGGGSMPGTSSPQSAGAPSAPGGSGSGGAGGGGGGGATAGTTSGNFDVPSLDPRTAAAAAPHSPTAGERPGAAPTPAPSQPPGPSAASASSVNLPENHVTASIQFEMNRGQTSSDVSFLARGSDHTLFITPDRAVFALTRSGESRSPIQTDTADLLPKAATHDVLSINFVGGNPQAIVTGVDELPSHSNYFIGQDPAQWHTDVPHYGRVLVEGVYPGVDLAYYGTAEGDLEFDLTVDPGSDPDKVRLEFKGALGTTLDHDGDLHLHMPAGEVIVQAPVLYQDIDGSRLPVAGNYTIDSRGLVGFEVGAHDTSRPLVIDPIVSYSTYLGGSGADEARGIIALDADGNAYVVGITNSVNFPTLNPVQGSLAGDKDIVVSKLNPSGTALVYSTYIGGTGWDSGNAIAVDSAGAAYITGFAISTNYPVTAGAYDTTGGNDAVVTKLAPAGNSLSYSTYLGTAVTGSAWDEGHAIAVDSSGQAVVAGVTPSWLSPFPTTSGAYQTSPGGAMDGFVTKFNAAGSALIWSTLLGGNDGENIMGLALDSSGNAYVVGRVGTMGSFPTTAGAFQTAYGGGSADGFVTKLNSSGSALVYSSFLGGGGVGTTDTATSIALDSSNNVYVTGSTSSTTFPLQSAWQTTLNGGSDAFLTKINSSGSAMVFSTYLGGSGDEGGNGIALDKKNRPVVAGFTSSMDLNVVNGAQVSLGGSTDAFVAKFNAEASALVHSTYWGGGADDNAAGIALDPFETATIAGTTSSFNFPVTAGAFQTTYGGPTTDAFVARLNVGEMPANLVPRCSDCVQDQVHSTVSGARGGDPAALGYSETGVRYNDGLVEVPATELESLGFGMPWGNTRSWTSGLWYASRGIGGRGNFITQLPYLIPMDLAPSGIESLAVITSGADARYFDLVSDVWQPRHFIQDALEYDAMADEYVLTDTTGARFRFLGFSNALPARQRGQFTSYADPYGNTVSVTSWTSAGSPAEVQRSGGGFTESLLYTYISGGVNDGLLSGVTLRRQPDGGGWSTVRQVSYTYYDNGDANGNRNDLKTAQVKDASNNVLHTWYARYYKPDDATGFAGGLKYVLSPDSYGRAGAALGNPLTATDAHLAPYADGYFEYDNESRVTKAIVAGAGSGTGLGTYTYSYTKSSNADGYNSWKVKTVETLPDGNQNTVYTNAYGEVMLHVFKDVPNNRSWLTYFQYDTKGRLILAANPSAVSGYSEGLAALVDGTYLNDNAGLISKFDFYTSTTATETTPGGVAGYAQRSKLQRGELGAPVLQDQVTYFTRAVPGITIAPVAETTVYRNNDGTGAQTASYTYTWFGTTAGIESLTVTLPVVTSGQNGPGTADASVTYFDSYGRPIWHKDGDGFLHYTAYDQGTGAVIKTITDVDTTRTSDFADLPMDWSTPPGAGLHLMTQAEVDNLGRPTKVTAPAGNVAYAVYKDTSYQMRVYPGWDSGTNRPTGPTQLARLDRAGGYYETLTMSATPTLTAGRPDGNEAIGNLETLARTHTNTSWQVAHSDVYFSLAGLAYTTAVALGTENTHFYRTRHAYDSRGRRNQVTVPTGTIYKTIYDAPGRPSSDWVGTSDANLVQTAGYVYDNAGIGDSNLTELTVYPGGGAANRVANFYADWRNRLVATKAGVEGTESTSLNRPIAYADLDNLGQIIASERYDGDNVTIADGNNDGVPDKPAASLIRARSTASFDEQGRPYRTQTFSVDQSSGAISSNSLTSNAWYGRRGQVLKSAAPGGLVSKAEYDGAGRLVKSYATDGGGDTAWADADDVTGDVVLEQLETQYDANSNPIFVTSRQRFHDEPTTGALVDPATAPKARASYAASYYDLADRHTATVNVGTNGGTPYTRPGTVPARSDTTLVVSYVYNTAGWVESMTDPRGIIDKIFYDNLGRTTKTIEAYVDGTPDTNSDRTTEFTYDGSGHARTLKAHLTGGAYQRTEFVYGVTTAGGSGVNSNDLLAEVRHPDKSTGDPSTTEKDIFTVNALGQRKTSQDRNGNVHTYSFDVLGRLTADAVTTLGATVDGAVRRAEIAYDTGGRPYLFTTYDAASAGNVVNQVQHDFNGLGQLTKEYQSHSGVVNVGTTPKVQYAYSEMTGGANHSRLTNVTYPNGKVLSYNYTAAIDAAVSRLTSLSDTTGTLESFDYLGLGTVVRRAHPQPGVDLTYIKQTAEANGDAGDQYTGLDRFGRVVDQRWRKTSDGSHTDRFKYGYDRNSNRLYRENVVNALFSELYHANGAAAGYDNLDQLLEFRRGTLSDTNSDLVPDTVATASRSQAWSLDAQGNWSTLTTDGTGVNRTHNKQNQVTAVGAATLTFDANGNLKTDETGKQFVFDAWNRLVQVKDSGGSPLATYKYDALGRRIVETVSGTTRDVYFSAAWQVLEEREAANVKTQYIWSPVYVDALVLRDRDADGNQANGLEERLYVQQDANFNVTALLNTSGSVVERYIYDPYGRVTFLAPDWTTRGSSSYAWSYLHQGGRYENLTGLYHFRNRDLSATLGRWVTQDPIHFAGRDLNLYRDVGNNPTKMLDPSGLSSTTPGGHHYVPQAILFDPEVRRLMTHAAFEVGMGHTSGETFPHHSNHRTFGGVRHNDYSARVRQHLIDYVASRRTATGNPHYRMTQSDMLSFAREIEQGLNGRGVEDPLIRRFNNAVQAEREAWLRRHPRASRGGITDAATARRCGRNYIASQEAIRFARGAALGIAIFGFIANEGAGALAVASSSRHFRNGVEALARGDLVAADREFIGDGRPSSFFLELNESSRAGAVMATAFREAYYAAQRRGQEDAQSLLQPQTFSDQIQAILEEMMRTAEEEARRSRQRRR